MHRQLFSQDMEIFNRNRDCEASGKEQSLLVVKLQSRERERERERELIKKLVFILRKK